MAKPERFPSEEFAKPHGADAGKPCRRKAIKGVVGMAIATASCVAIRSGPEVQTRPERLEPGQVWEYEGVRYLLTRPAGLNDRWWVMAIGYNWTTVLSGQRILLWTYCGHINVGAKR